MIFSGFGFRFSLVAFSVGCYFAYVAIQGIAASQPH
jgi:hypothetical protein